MSKNTCDKCNDTGKIGHEERTAQGLTSFWTTLCACRRDLPPRDGKVTWWTYGKSKSWEMKTTADWLTATISASAELPVSEDGYPLRRTQSNAYFGAKIHIELEGDEVLVCDDLRELGRWLLKVADEVDVYDAIVPDATNHPHTAGKECGTAADPKPAKTGEGT